MINRIQPYAFQREIKRGLLGAHTNDRWHYQTGLFGDRLPRHRFRTSSTTIMATELTVQSERAYQKQPHIFVNQKTKRTKSTKVGKGGRRWYKDVGLGFRTPKTAIEGHYIGIVSLGIKFSHKCFKGQGESSGLTCHPHIRQEMPLHWRSLHPWPDPHRHCRLHQNASYARHPPRVSPLYSQILEIRETAQELGGACQSCIPCGGWRSGHSWAMQAFEQNGMWRAEY